VSGLTAAYVLRSSHQVTLFEADDRLGGHADTHDVDDLSAGSLAVDTGFQVYNARSSPTLLRLFDELGVRVQPADLSLSVRCDGCGLEYSGGQGMGRMLSQGRSLLRPRFARMLLEVARFHRQVGQIVSGNQALTGDPTMADFLAQGNYSPYFAAHFVIPLIATAWFGDGPSALQFPAGHLFAFLARHGSLGGSGSTHWRTVVGGSRGYVQRAVKDVTTVRTGTPIRSVTRSVARSGADADRAAVEVRDTADRVSEFDAVVIATRPDRALALLEAATADEQAVLGAFSCSTNSAVLHTDPSVLADGLQTGAAWNYRMAGCSGTADRAQVSCDLTRLQRLGTAEQYIVSLNHAPADQNDPEPSASRVRARMEYAHPQFTPASVAAQKLLPGLNDGVTAFAGAYHGWGFHEDGARSGLAAAISLGGGW
jgi:predicted NAD/FAD-binding protein